MHGRHRHARAGILLFSVAALSTATGAASAQDPDQPDRPAAAEATASIRIPRISRPPTLDDFVAGRAREAHVTGFRQREPRDGRPASEETSAYLSYDDQNLYVVFICKAVEPERRLRGVTLNRQLTLSHSRIHADEELLVCALSGLLMAMLGQVARANAQVAVLARLDPGGDFTFSVTQDGTTIPSTWLALGREEAPIDCSGGIATVALLAGRRIVEACEGRMAVTASGRRSGVHIAIPSLP